MPIFLSGLQTGERKKQGEPQRFLLIRQLGVNDLTLLIPVPKCLPSLLTWLNHPVPLPVTAFIHNSYFGLIITLVEAGETLCGTRHWFVLHLIQHDASLCQVGLSPGKGGRIGGKFRRCGNDSVIWGLHLYSCCPTGTDLAQLLSFPVHLACFSG